MSYIPNTDADRAEMLAAIGVKQFDDLLSSIPEKLRLGRPLDIPALSEMELLAEISEIAGRNKSDLVCFAGGGVYDQFATSAAATIFTRPEFMTAYTPYQPEVAQGTLQVIYEFQTHLCRLTGMDVANASLYDGATATAEAVILACAATKRSHVILAGSLNPSYAHVTATYLSARDMQIETAPMKEGLTDLSRLRDLATEQTACIVLAMPNFFGLLEQVDQIRQISTEVGAKLILVIDPIAQALLKTPAEWGADIAVGEGQPLGLPMSFGGPLVGFLAAKKDLIRNFPGRIAARTTDLDGKTGYVLTLQTREQHIRRDKATSNICTNQALCATAVTVHLSLLGKSGLRTVALLSMERAQQLAARIFEIDGFRPYFNSPFVREFAVKTPVPAAHVIAHLKSRGILAGIDAGRWYPQMQDCLIVATTEKRTIDEINRFASALAEMRTDRVLSHM